MQNGQTHAFHKCHTTRTWLTFRCRQYLDNVHVPWRISDQVCKRDGENIVGKTCEMPVTAPVASHVPTAGIIYVFIEAKRHDSHMCGWCMYLRLYVLQESRPSVWSRVLLMFIPIWRHISCRMWPRFSEYFFPLSRLLDDGRKGRPFILCFSSGAFERTIGTKRTPE